MMEALEDEQIANNGVGDNMWPPQHIAHYNYDENIVQNDAESGLVDMDLDLEEDEILGNIDVRQSEHENLLASGGDIDVAPQYQDNKKKNKKNKKNNPENDRLIKISKGIMASKKNKKKKGLIGNIADHIGNNIGNQIGAQFMRGGGGGDAQNLAKNIVINQKDNLNKNYSKNNKKQNNIHTAPKLSNLGAHAWCVALFYWIPIRYLCFLGNLALFILPFLDVRFQNISFIEWLLYWYIQIFAIIGLFIESPTWILTRKIQLKIFKWCRVLRRTWGRACFYLSISLLTFAELGSSHSFSLSMFAGIYMVIISVIMLVFSMLAAKQYRCMYWYMKMGGNVHGETLSIQGDEYDDLDTQKIESRISSYFNSLDEDRDGKIGAAEIHALAEQSLKRNLSNAERYTIQTFLDRSCNGFITKQDWMKQFLTYNKVKFL